MSQFNDKPGLKFSFRSVMHIVIGILYLGIAGYLITVNKFGAVDLGKPMSYALGGLLLVYGGFRIWRGIQDMKTDGDQ